jgi:hypothetical protein
MGDSVFQVEFDLAGKDLAGSQRHHLALVILNIRVLQHGKLIGSPGGCGSNFVHITIVFYKFFKGKYHDYSIYLVLRDCVKGFQEFLFKTGVGGGTIGPLFLGKIQVPVKDDTRPLLWHDEDEYSSRRAFKRAS